VLRVSGVEVTDIEAAHSSFGGQNTGSNEQDSATAPDAQLSWFVSSNVNTETK